MSDYRIEVTENIVNLDVIQDHDITIEITSSDNFITFNTPSGYPILSTSGILPVDRVASGYPIENLLYGNTIVRTSGDQAISGIKTFNTPIFVGDITSSGFSAIKSQSTAITPSHFPVFISDPSTFSRNIYTRTPSQVKSDLGLSNVQNLALSGIVFSAGSGLVGGGSLSSNRSFDIGQGDGLIVSADNISVDSTVVRTNGDQTINGPKTFTNTLIFNSGSFQSLKVGSSDVSLSGHTHSISNINGLQAVLDLKQPSGSYALSNHSHSSFPSLYLGSPNLDTCLNIIVPSSYETNQYQDTSVLQITNDDLASTVFAIDGLGQIRYGTINSTNVNGLNNAITAQIPTTIVHTTGNQSISGIKTFNNNINVSGLITANSGNFINSLKINGTDVSISGHTHAISNITGLQTALDNKQPSGSYASSSHTHTSSDITNFNTSVSGLVNGIYAPLNSPSFTGTPLTPTASAGTNSTQIASTAFVRTEISNLVASAPTALDTLNELASALGNDANFSTTVTNNLAGKASLTGATFTGSISGPSGNFTSLKVNSVDVSANGHTHTSSNITDFNSSVSGLLTVKNVTAGNYVNLSSTNGNYTIAVTGLQPSGNYSLIGHTHVISDITSLQTTLDGKQALLTNPVTGTGTNNYHTKWTSSSSIGNSLIYDNGTNIGIGTSSPNAALEVSGIIRITDGAGRLQLYRGGGTVYDYSIGKESNHLAISTASDSTTNRYTQFGYHASNGTWNPKTVINNYNGAVGIGTTSPSADFHVNGSGLFASGLNISNQTASTIASFDSNKNIISLTTGTYPSLTELSYVKGLTSAVQTQIDSKAASSHTHTSSNITDFNSSVSGLVNVKNITAGNYINLSSTTGNYTISVTGLQPSGNYSLVGHTHIISDVTNLQTVLDGKQPSGNYAASSHTHTASQITDFNTSVDSRITSANLQPSGNYSLVGHTHTSSNITDFNSSVSGLLTPYQLSLTNPVTGIGTSGYLTKWVSSGGLSSGIIFDNGSSIGINTNTPSSSTKLEVNGNINQTWSGSDTRFATVYDNNYRMGINFAANQRIMNIFSTSSESTNGHIIFSTRSSGGSSSTDYGSERMRITGAGLVGISTTTPSGQLHVVGTGLFSSKVGIGTNSPSYTLDVNGSGNFTSLNVNGSGVGLYDTSVLSLGTITGSNAINCGQDRQIQTLTLNGTATTFTKGTGWPSSNSVSRDITLNITASSNTSVTWTVVTDWYRQPDSPLPSGSHIVLLRAIGSGIIQGHYIGSKTN